MQKLFPHCHLPARSLTLSLYSILLSLSHLIAQISIDNLIFILAFHSQQQQQNKSNLRITKLNPFLIEINSYCRAVCIYPAHIYTYTYTETNPTLCWLDTVHSLIHSEGCHNSCCPLSCCCLVNWCVFDCKFVTNISLECTASQSLPSLPSPGSPLSARMCTRCSGITHTSCGSQKAT